MAARKRQFNSRTYAIKALEGVDVTGKTYAITGTTSGIGIDTARVLVLKGAHVVMINRNMTESEKLKTKILEEKPDGKIDIVACDLNSLQSVQKAAEEYLSKDWPIHGLILNAGVFGPNSKITADGFESHFGINHVAHFILIRELLPVIRRSAPARIVILSSALHKHHGVKQDSSIEEKLKDLCPEVADKWYFYLYSKSKMCNMLTAFKLHRDESANGISVYAVHPGVVRTELHRDAGVAASIFKFFSVPFTKSISQGAATSVYCAAHPEVEKVSGKYWDSCWDDECELDKKVARDEELQEALWKHTEEVIDKWLKTKRTTDNDSTIRL